MNSRTSLINTRPENMLVFRRGKKKGYVETDREERERKEKREREDGEK
jgi:hypothetical protein